MPGIEDIGSKNFSDKLNSINNLPGIEDIGGKNFSAAEEKFLIDIKTGKKYRAKKYNTLEAITNAFYSKKNIFILEEINGSF